jgi:aryl-alcohol dehydrogenase-like predicted oxidoreductase
METPPEGTRIHAATEKGWSEAWSVYNNERTWNILDTLFTVAQETDKMPAQVALNWVMNRPGITAPISGVRTMEQLESNLGALGWTLSSEQMERLSEVSEPQKPYPYDFISRNERR